jgi:hypothetical protein
MSECSVLAVARSVLAGVAVVLPAGGRGFTGWGTELNIWPGKIEPPRAGVTAVRGYTSRRGGVTDL